MHAQPILASIMTIMMLLATCGNASASEVWENWIKDLPDGQFEKADDERFVLEHDGFSVELTVQKWIGRRGAGEYVLHPAYALLPLRERNPSDCVIPFVIKGKTTTADDSFTTDYRFHLKVLGGSGNMKDKGYGWEGKVEFYTCDTSWFEAENKRKEYFYADAKEPKEAIRRFRQETGNSWGKTGGDFRKTKPGETHTVLGVFIIKNYYSPKFPNGNVDMLPDGGAALEMHATINDSRSENFTFTLLEE